MNELIVRLPKRWWLPFIDARVTVSGFAPSKLHLRNAYMEWLLPTGAYDVEIDAGGKKHLLHYELQMGERVDIVITPPAPRWWKLLCWAALLITAAALVGATLWWELMHQYYTLAGLTLLLVLAVVVRLYLPWRAPRWQMRRWSLYRP
jgi:hypothetical protein